MKNIVISGTNFWNPGDDFVREGVIRILKEVFADEPLNFLFYNFNPDFYPQEELFAGSNIISRGDLEKYRDSVDAVVIVGVSAGHELKPLYRWVLANGLEERVYLISGHYESPYCADHITEEPEATIFRKARILIGRTKKFPDFIRSAGIPYHHVNCPALLSVPEVKVVPNGKKIERVGFSIQLPRALGGLVNQFCADEPYQLAISALCDLARQYQVEVVAHHKTEYFHFLNVLQGTGIPVIFSSFYHHFFETYRRYDLVVTTRLHASLFANGHGIPGIIINDTDRHTHTLEGFPHSPWVNTREAFESALARWQQADLSVIAREADEFKSKLLAQYVQILRPVMAENNQPAAKTTVKLPELDEPAAVSAVENVPGLLDGVQRMLFVRTDSIGDLVLASAMLEPLRKKFPRVKLAVLCQQHAAELLTSCPLVDSIICYDRKKMDVPAEREQIISEIAAFQPDVILNSVRSRDKLSDDLTLAHADAQHIAIAGDLDNLSEAERESARARYERIIPTSNTHQAELARHGDFLRGLGVETSPLQPVVWTSPEDEALADTFFQHEKLDPQRTLALFPFSQHAIKDYPAFAAALKDFAGWDILLMGGSETRERCEQLAGQLAGGVRNLAGRTTLREMAAIIRHCKILVGSDTCGAHIACAVGVPNVVVLGGGHFGRFMPYSPLTTAVSLPMDCFGCNWQCRYAGAHCITRLMPEVVAAAIVSALRGSSRKPRLFAQTDRRGTVQPGLPSALAAWLRPGEVDVTPVPMNRPLTLAWPSLQYGEGVYKDEGDFRWLAAEAELQVSVPAGGQPVNLAFELRAGEMAWYPARLLHVQVAVNDRTQEHFIFQTDHQFAQVRLPLPPAAQPHSVRIRTDQFFTGENPVRRLAVQLRQAQLTEAKTAAPPVKILENPESTLRQAADLCTQAGRLDYGKLKAIYPKFEEALDAWITPRLGFSIQPNSFDQIFPLVEQRFESQLEMMRQHAAEVIPFIQSPKLAAIPRDKVDEVTPYWTNDYFHPGDARLAYAMVARYRPQRIIECGCGNSTKFMRRAATDYQTGTQILCIDPEPRANIQGVADQFHQASTTTMDPAFFDQLAADDFLFVDGSHLVLNGSDCVHLFLNVLTRLRPGVWVHFHDIFLPHDYPYELHVSCRYNEQYMLAQLFLYSQEWLPALPIYYAHKKKILPHGGGSFWMRKL
jgi:ADP-heptose:LPS heptosyltransferase